MFYSEDVIEEIRVRNDIVDVISSYVRLQKKGNNHVGLCPFHNEKSPSFAVSQHKQMYHCFGCGVSGNSITFIMEYENYTFVEAIKLLAGRVGINLPEAQYSEEEKNKKNIKTIILEIYKQAAKYYYYQLKSQKGLEAYNYLKRREISEDTIKKFGLGYSDNNLYKYIKQLGYEDNILRQTGLFTFEERGVYDKFWNRVMFPIMDVNNKVIGFGGRVIGDAMPKYLNSPETMIFDKSRNLYGLNHARISRKKNILICEGYMDVISLHQAGFHNVCASLGTAFTGLQANILKRYTQEVHLTYDSDEAGIKAALRAIPILKEAGLTTKVINLNPYKDPDEFIKALGVDEFNKRISNASNSFLFEIETLESNYNLSDPDNKTKFYNAIATKLLEFTEEIERTNYMETIAKKYNIEFENLRKLVNSLGAKLSFTKEIVRPQTGTHNKKNIRDDGFRQSQKILLTWLIEDVTLFEKIKGIIEPDDFFEDTYIKAANLLFMQYNNEKNVTPAKVINYFESKEEQNEVASLFNTQIHEEMSTIEKEKALNDTIKKIKQHSLELKSKNTDPTDISKLQDIIIQKRNLQKLHISLNDG